MIPAPGSAPEKSKLRDEHCRLRGAEIIGVVQGEISRQEGKGMQVER